MEESTEYELKIKRAFQDAVSLNNSTTINDKENWEFFTMNLLRLKLLSVKD